MRPFLVGLVGALTGILIATLVALAVIVWNRAANGQQAFDYLARQLANQQQAQPAKPVIPGVK